MMQRLLFLVLACGVGLVSASGHQFALDHAPINLRDKASLQRGAQLFANYCQGCHSLQFMRYRRLAEDSGMVDESGNVLTTLVKDNLMFSVDKIGDTMLTAMQADDAKKWFASIPPPDLSLTARKNGADWLYTYLRAFYKDETRPWGVNNAVFDNVAMPHVLVGLQGVQMPVYKENEHGKKVIEKLELQTPGLLPPEEYNKRVADLVNFLVYVSEPGQLTRQQIGVWVVMFLIVMSLLAYFLKRAYWKDVH